MVGACSKLALADSDLAKDAMETPPKARLKKGGKGKRKKAMKVAVGGKSGKEGNADNDGAGGGGKKGKSDNVGAGGGAPKAMKVVGGVSLGKKLKMDKKSVHSRAWHSTFNASKNKGMDMAAAKLAASKAGKAATESLG